MSVMAVAALAAPSILLTSGASATQPDAARYDFLNVDIRVLAGKDLLITETQSYTFGTSPSRYGYRWLPLSEDDSISEVMVYEGARRYRRDPAVRDWIRNPDASPPAYAHAFSSWAEDGKLWIVWWYPEAAAESRTFHLRYRVHDGLAASGERGQVAWRAVFQNRALAIGSARVAVHLQSSVEPSDIQVQSSGVAATSRIIRGRTVEYETGAIAGDEKLDVRVEFPLPDAIAEGRRPGGRIGSWTAEQADAFGRWIDETSKSAGGWLAGHPAWAAAMNWLSAILAAALVYLSVRWIMAIRRARTGSPVPAPATTLREPPDDLPPAIVTRLLSGGYDFVGDVFHMARCGCLRIVEEVENRRHRVRRDLVFARGPATPPCRYQRLLLDLLLDGRPQIRLSEERKFRPRIARRIRAEMETEASEMRLLRWSAAAAVRGIGPGARHLPWVGTVGVVLGGSGMALSVSLQLGWGVPLLAGAIGIVGLAVLYIAMSPGMFRLTTTGAGAAAGWQAFGGYLSSVASGRLPPDRPACFDRFLPYAVAFRLDAAWTRAWAAQGRAAEIPPWYQPGSARLAAPTDRPTLGDVSRDFRRMVAKTRRAMTRLDGGWGGAAPAIRHRSAAS